ncbi:MAG: 6-phosphogluconolactonase [Paludibacter sp.]|nr:6-phosphogluconolactonase [Paludibacter sp.]
MYENLHVFDSPYDTAHAVAEIILEKAKEKHKLSLPLNIAVSGGNTPKILFTILTTDFSESIPWNIIRLFWVDERCVPPTHPDSNFGMTYESLLKHLPIHDTNIFRMDGEINPEKEAIRYQKVLEKELPTNNGFPQFDLILLGMGDDGHTASIFPNDLSLLKSPELVSVGIHPTTGQKRITLTGQTINQAKEIIFLITGNSKADVLRQIIHHEPTFEKYPAAFIHTNSGNVEFYIDKAAASQF